MAAPLRKRAVAGGGGGGRGDPSKKKKAKKLKETKDTKKQSRSARDEEISSEDDEWTGDGRNASFVEEEEEEEGVEAQSVETADEKRLRLAQAFLERTRQSAAEAEDEDDEDERTTEQRRGARDSMVADLLQQEQLEESGRVQRKLAARVGQPTSATNGKSVGRRHRQSVTAICLTEDDSTGFSGSKDGMLVQWNIETGQSDKYEFPSGLANGRHAHGKKGGNTKGSKHILTVAVSSDGRYLASGGLDRAVHLWDIRTRQHLQAFDGHRGAVTSLVFRQGTQQLMSGSLDRTIKLWSVDERTYLDTLFGHQSEILALDCLRQERILSVGRDRTLRLWKIPEESQLVFRGHQAHMESCCFISNGEFLSGSDDGCVALWNTVRKKPVFIAHSVHGSKTEQHVAADMESAERPVTAAVEAWVGAVAVCRNSDLAASGAGDGTVQLWELENSNSSLRALHKLPVEGFVNSLAFAHSGRFVLAGTGQEPRMGRWGRKPVARNGVVMHSIDLL